MEDVAKRKERLKAIRERKERRDGGLSKDESEDKGETDLLPKPLFRSYKPNDENLQLSHVLKAKPINVADLVKDEIEAAQQPHTVDDVKMANLAPRKIDWDLKRDVAKRLKKLKRRTDRAIVEIAREELQKDSNNVLFWNTREEAAVGDVDEDDDD